MTKHERELAELERRLLGGEPQPIEVDGLPMTNPYCAQKNEYGHCNLLPFSVAVTSQCESRHLCIPAVRARLRRLEGGR